jgi:cholestenol delta-isomerase
MAADSAPPLHPYFPEGILLSGNNFVPNDWDVATLILAFAAGITVILGITLVVVRKINPRLKLSDQGLILWFVMCGLFRSAVFRSSS